MRSAARAASSAAAQRPRRVVRRVPVTRELGRELAVAAEEPLGVLAEEFGDAGVQRNAISREEIVVHGFVHQRVPEAISHAVVVGDEHLFEHGIAQRLEQLRLGKLHERGEQAVVGTTTDHGRAAQHFLRDRRQRVDAREHDLAQRLGEGVAVGIVGGEELLGEERVAIGTGVGAVDELGRRIAADDRGDELAQLVAIEARELDAFDDAGSVELGERRSQRVPPVQVVGAIGPEQHDPSRAQAAREVHEEIARRPVGPMQVFEHDQRRNPIAEPFEHAEQLLEQRGRAELRILGRGDAVQLGDERREIVARRTDDGLEGDVVERAVQRAQRLDDRTERERAIDDLDAAAR